MFNKKIKERIKKLEDDIKRIELKIGGYIDSFISCEICGCTVNKCNAVKGKSTIERNYKYYSRPFTWSFLRDKEEKSEEIREHYFCKKCAPKNKKK